MSLLSTTCSPVEEHHLWGASSTEAVSLEGSMAAMCLGIKMGKNEKGLTVDLFTADMSLSEKADGVFDNINNGCIPLRGGIVLSGSLGIAYWDTSCNWAIGNVIMLLSISAGLFILYYRHVKMSAVKKVCMKHCRWTENDVATCCEISIDSLHTCWLPLF